MNSDDAKKIAIKKLIEYRYKNWMTFQCVDDDYIEKIPNDENTTVFALFGDPVCIATSIAHAMASNEDLKKVMLMAINAFEFMENDLKEKQN